MLLRVLIVAASTVMLTGVAIAGEANGEPFPGPDNVIHEDMQKPNYTMGGQAPFNYFYAPTPTPLNGYHAAAGSNQDPYPFKANGQVIQLRPPAPSTVVAAPHYNNHG